MLQQISITHIYPHPKNPRHDVGDVTELAESIKTQGILQNLTVVPLVNYNHINDGLSEFDAPADDDEYTVIIGHRRLAAAKLAGLTEVPCTVTEMDERTQIATMLLENIQRADLTVLEQAEGFQMMLDLGETIKTISDKTGFSDSTVRHRIKLNELDKQKFTEATIRGGRMEDYIALEQLKNTKTKNKVLEYIGTKDFKWQLDCALEQEAKPALKKALNELLSSFAKPKKEAGKKSLEYVKNFYGYKHEGWTKPADAETEEYFFDFNSSSAALYKAAKKAEPKKLTAQEKAFNKREAKLKDLAKRAYEMRRDFVKDFTASKTHVKKIQKFAFGQLLRCSSAGLKDVYKALTGEKVEIYNQNDSAYIDNASLSAKIVDLYDAEPERVMLIVTYCKCDDGPSNDYFSAQSWNKKITYEKNRHLDALYAALISMGYQLSEEEQQLCDGTHELFDQEAK